MELRGERAEQRVEKALVAMATFSRIGEELLAMRAVTVAGVAMERLDRMIQLNRDTHSAVKRSLMIAEGDLARQKPGAEHARQFTGSDDHRPPV